MPRKSLAVSSPHVATPTPATRQKRSAPTTSPSSTLRPSKRPRRAKVDTTDDAEAAHPNENQVEETSVNAGDGGDAAQNNPPLGAIIPEDEMVRLEGEAELEAWQDFVMDHYEMVEQLPLELHRNFRLLRELDDDCTAQTTKLHELIRNYVGIRLGRSFKLTPPSPVAAPETAPDMGAAQEPLAGTQVDTIEQGQPGQADTAGQDQATNQPQLPVITNGEDTSAPLRQATAPISDEPSKPLSTKAPSEPPQAPPVSTHPDPGAPTEPSPTAPPPPPAVDEEVHSAEDLGVPQPDGQGGLLLSPRPHDTSHLTTAPHSLPFPSATDKQEEIPALNTFEAAQQGGIAALQPAKKHPSVDLLPEIGKLMREIVRNGEEKYAVALGAYNAIDRHIRALDSALSAQEASILLGLRPDTNPSAAVDTSLNLPADSTAVVENDDGEVAIGLGGGGGRKSRKNKKGRKKAEAVEEEVAAPIGRGGFPYIDLTGYEIDPYEPKFCYCRQASHGQMVGCENDDCPYEWFHLQCVGLTQVPAAAWWCNECKPRPGAGMGGAGTVAARTGPAAEKKRSKAARKK